MATPIGRKIDSSYAFKNTGLYDKFRVFYYSSTQPRNRPNIWNDWWFNQIVINNLEVDLSDSLSSGGGGGSYTYS